MYHTLLDAYKVGYTQEYKNILAKSLERALFETCKSTVPDLSVCFTCELPESLPSQLISHQLAESAENMELDSSHLSTVH